MQDELQQIEQLLESGTGAEESHQSETQAIDELLEPTSDVPEKEAADDAIADEAETPDSGIDYTLEVPMTDGTKLSLGALKDHYQDYAAKVDALTTRENGVMQQINEAQELLAMTRAVPAHLKEKVQQDQQHYLESQHNLMLQVMPDMVDAAVFNQVKADIFALAKEYGVTDVVGQVADHRVVKMLRDFAHLRQQLRTVKDNVKPIRNDEPKGKAAAKSNQAVNTQNAIANAKKSGTHGAQVAAIDMLLR